MANKEYIERNALLKDIDSSIVFTVRSDIKHPPEIQGAKKVIERIRVAPVVDVVNEIIKILEERLKEKDRSLKNAIYVEDIYEIKSEINELKVIIEIIKEEFLTAKRNKK